MKALADAEIGRRLLANTMVTDSGCVEWSRARMKKGYGVTTVRGAHWLTHRLSYLLHFGVLPEVVRHKCDNPPCVNIEHLEGGTYADNSKDMVDRGRSTRGERTANSKLKESDVLKIRSLYEEGETQRELGKRFSVDTTTIHYVVSRKTWDHI